MTNKRHIVLILILAGLIVSLSPFLIGTTELKNDKVILRSGFPITFIEQDTTYSVLDYNKAQSVTILSPLENPTRVIWIRMGISFITVYAMLFCIFKGIKFR